MPKIWITSDTHFGHINIIKYCNRPYADVTEMNNALIANINSQVAPEDTLIHAGDFCFGDYNAIIRYRQRINCQHIQLVLGNHDRMIFANRYRLINIFEKIEDYLVFLHEGRIHIINHYPLGSERNEHKVRLFTKMIKDSDAKYLFGHTHKDEPDNVGVDSNRYSPILLN